MAFIFLLAMLLQTGQLNVQGTAPKDAKGKLVINVLNLTKHGLSIVVQTPEGKTYLFDAGEEVEGKGTIEPFLKANGIKQIDGLLISHAHADHFGGAPYLLEHFPVKSLLVSPYDRSETVLKDHSRKSEREQIDDMHAIRQSAEKRGAKIVELVKGKVLDWDPSLKTEVLWPPKELVFSQKVSPLIMCNDNSVVLRIVYGKTVIILPGDIRNTAAERLVSETPEKLKADVVVAPHHGMLYNCPHFGEATRPKVAIISAALNEESPTHANFASICGIKIFGPVGSRIYSTCWQGTVCVVSDGREVHVTCDGCSVSQTEAPKE